MRVFRIGIDIGGTFTDLVAFNEESGITSLIKVPSTPGDPSEGMIKAVKIFKEKEYGEISLIVHASTIGTNLFLGQLGLNIPKGALVTTSGFRDILEIGRQNRAELYNPFFERPESLIEQRLRYTVKERMGFKGDIIETLDESEVKLVAKKIREEGAEVVAVVFLHAYANPGHEMRAKEILCQELPNTVIIASFEVDPEYREYERMSTTVINSLLIPVISGYLNKIKGNLEELGIFAPLYIMQSNGGLAGVEIASKIPVSTIESGPATGVIASAYWSKILGVNNILSFDMGGTTAKAGAIINGKPQMVEEYEVGGAAHSGRIIKGSGYPVRYPFVDLAEVSGGGGTIAWVDQGSVLRVGPLSAGADPGPACYGRGGESPTVTDANLVLGRLNSKGLSGGDIEIFPDIAEKALREKISGPLGISSVQAAYGVIEIVNSHMMRSLRLVSIERGNDPRDFTMLAFGGCGCMHAAYLADGLGIKKIYIPPNPGVYSALGLLLADFRHDYVRSVMKPSSNIDYMTLSSSFEDMEEEAAGILHKEGFASDNIIMEKKLALRYMGQSYELELPLKDSFDEVINDFHLRHRQRYGYAAMEEPVEVVNAHITAYGIIMRPEFKKAGLTIHSSSIEAITDRRMVFFKETDWIETSVYSRDALLPGNRIKGPSIIEQYDATTIIPPGWNALVDEYSNLCLTKGDN